MREVEVAALTGAPTPLYLIMVTHLPFYGRDVLIHVACSLCMMCITMCNVRQVSECHYQ